jgi:hypothetical protein
VIGTFGPASLSDGWHTLNREVVEMRDTPLLGEILWEWVNRGVRPSPLGEPSGNGGTGNRR